MDRRRQLGTVALTITIAAAAVLLIGSAGSVFAQDGNQSNATDGERIDGTETVPIGNEAMLDDSFFGHFVEIEHTGSSPQEIGLTLRTEASGGPILDETYTFTPGATLTVEIYEPGNYSGVVRSPGDEATFDQPPFECGSGVQTNVMLAEGGDIEMRTDGIAAGCITSPPNETTSTEDTADEATPSNADEATAGNASTQSADETATDGRTRTASEGGNGKAKLESDGATEGGNGKAKAG